MELSTSSNHDFVVKGYLQEHVQGRAHGVEHIPWSEQGTYILIKALTKIKLQRDEGADSSSRPFKWKLEV